MNTRKPLRMPLGDTEHMLEQWGLWRMDGMGVPSYVSPSWAIMRDVMPSASKSYAITDELAELVDGAVARLCKRAPQMGDMVWVYYGAKWPAKRVGTKYGISEAKAREIIKTGVGWIDCSLEKFLQAA